MGSLRRVATGTLTALGAAGFGGAGLGTMCLIAGFGLSSMGLMAAYDVIRSSRARGHD